MKKGIKLLLINIGKLVLLIIGSVAVIGIMHYKFNGDLETLFVFIGVVEVLGGLFPFFHEVKHDLPRHQDQKPYEERGTFVAFFQAKSLIQDIKHAAEKKINLSWIIVTIICGIIMCSISLLV